MLDWVYIKVYTLYRGDNMQTAKIFMNGRSQAVRLPKEYQFRGNEVYIQKHGDAVLLFPHGKLWEIFIEGINDFSDDFMATGREQGNNQERESF